MIRTVEKRKSTIYSVIDESTNFFKSQQLEYRDTFNNYTFSVTEARGSTFISPTPKDASLVELKIGVLLPFHQHDDEKTRILTLSGISAIRLAVAEINRQELIPGAYITLIEKDSFPISVQGQPAMSQAVFSAMSLIQEGVVGMIGDISSSWTSLSALLTSTLETPQCSFSAVATSLSDKSQFGYFFRTVPTKLLYLDAAIQFVNSQGWSEIGVLYSNDDFGKQLSEHLVLKARRQGIQVVSYQSFYEDGSPNDIRKSLNTIISTGVRIIFVAAQGDAQTAAFVLAAHENYMNDRLVWITPELNVQSLFSAVNQYNTVLSDRAMSLTKSYLEENPIVYAATTATQLHLINYSASFSGGLFSLEFLKDLSGYEPYDAFVNKWSQLDSTIYPYSGYSNDTSNEGLAYSCMMLLARGFNNTIHNSSLPNTSQIELLQKLASGQLGQYLTPSAFNTSFIGPEGPIMLDSNGDVISGNFKLYNIQNGYQVEIGKMIANNLSFTSLPIYHDGTTKIPASADDRVLLNLDYSSPVIIAFVVVISFCSFVTILIWILVFIYQKRSVFKTSNALFCMLQLLGFLLTYISVFLFVGTRTKLACAFMPTTFHLGYALIVGSIIAKNYQIYRVFNNIFISKTIVTDRQLLKILGPILSIYVILLTALLTTNNISLKNIPVSKDSYYIICSYNGPAHTAFGILLTIIGALQMVFVTFLAFKIRKIARIYPKYIEYKYIVFSVYNIFFSTIISFVISSIPAIGYYTRHYLVATMILWAASFSLLVFFIPKLYVCIFPEKKWLNKISDKACDLGEKLRKRGRSQAVIGIDTIAFKDESLGKPEDNIHLSQIKADCDVTPLSKLTSNPLYLAENSMVRLNQLTKSQSAKDNWMEIYEMNAPVQEVLTYFPFLAAWEMMHVVLMPDICYFSCYNEKTNKGKVFSYSGASILINQVNEHVLKVHGLGMFDIILQVKSEADLYQWNDWFNSSLELQSKDSFLKSSHDSSHADTKTRQTRLDSCMTTHQLLNLDTYDDGRESRTSSTFSVDRNHQITSESESQNRQVNMEPIHPLCETRLSANI